MEENYRMIRDSKLIKDLENVDYKTQQILKFTVVQCEHLAHTVPHPELIVETVDSLKQTIRKVLITNKVIPEPLAVAIAKVVAFTNELELELTKKKTPELQKNLKAIFDVASDITRHQLEPAVHSDTIELNIIDNVKLVLTNLTGNPTEKQSVSQTFDRILDKVVRREVNGVLPISVMKTASLIMQSNNDSTKRKQVLDSII